MGNTWAKYWTFVSQSFEQRFWNFPKMVNETQWQDMVNGSTAFFARQYERMLSHLAPSVRQPLMDAEINKRVAWLLDGEDSVAPSVAGGRRLDTREAAQVILEYCASECGVEYWTAWDVCRRMNGGCLEIDQNLAAPMRPVWYRFQRTLGFASNSENLPWWLHTAYPSDHCIGLTPPNEIKWLWDDLQATETITTSVDLVSKSNPQMAATLEQVMNLLGQAASTDCWFLAIESGS